MSGAPVTLTSIARGHVALKGVPPAPEGVSAKATRYAVELYDARCGARWDVTGELARKLEKHAPKRRCMALAARAGARMYSKPSRESFKHAEDEFGEHLSQALGRVELLPIDILDGTVTRAAMYLGVGRTQSALSLIPESLHRIAPPPVGSGPEAWISICVLQGTLIRGLCLELTENESEATNTYRTAIGYLAHIVKISSQCLELRRWLEELLSRICLFFSKRPGHLGEAMASFHLLSQYLDAQTWRPLASRGTFSPQTPRQVWRAYFETLSKIIQDDLVYHPSPLYRDHESLEHRGLLDDDEFSASRMKQRADLRRVESNYETCLLEESRFPKANETNQEVTSWVELVMGNFNILCGPTWTSQELGAGPGGKAVVARNTLDILYRAAEKTFHSTQILRHLFTVHAYLGEFDIAFKAFDTYVEIMTRGKARAERSGTTGIDLDDDETAVRFASEAIRVLCRQGGDATAEKALSIGETLRYWAGLNSSKRDANHLPGSKPSGIADESGLSPDTIGLAYRMVGISQALFARSTSQPASRAEMQKNAIENLRKSLQQDLKSGDQIESYYSLSLVLAETRDIPGAIQNVRQGLEYLPEQQSDLNNLDGVFSSNSLKDSVALNEKEVSKHAKNLPVWHLLAQLLCAREEYDLASACCDLALERLGGVPALLEAKTPAHATQHTSAKDFAQSSNAAANSPNVVDSMDNLEKQVVLEIKMTSLALSEILGGPESAVNETNELLALFARLFGPIDIDAQRKSKGNSMMSPPKSSSGTIRSIFGRSKSTRRPPPANQPQSTVPSQPQSVVPSNTGSSIPTRPTTSATNRPVIQVTSPTDGTPPVPPVLDNERKPNVLRKKSSSIRRHETSHQHASTAELNEKEHVNGAELPKSSHARVSFQGKTNSDENIKPKQNGESQALDSKTSAQEMNESHAQEPGQTARQDTRPFSSYTQKRLSQSTPIFVEIQEQRFITTLVTKIWLFVARLYSKASLFDDAKEAITQARKHVSNLEERILQQNPSIRELQDQGWGHGKSVDELWADVFCEDGKLQEFVEQPQDALDRYEIALSHDPDHPEATVALSNILLDIYCQVIRREKASPLDSLRPQIGSSTAEDENLITDSSPVPPNKQRKASALPEPEELSRLTSRDRAYGLLSSLTRLGSGWDDAEAWFVLARAYEESSQVEKAKDALWWTVQLEDTSPIRHWRNVHPASYVL